VLFRSQEKLNLRHRYLNDDFSINTGMSYTHLDQQTAGFTEGFESYKDDEIAQQNFDPNAFRNARSLRLWSKAQWQSANDTLTITPYVRKQSMTFFKHFLPGTPLEENSQTGVGIQSLWQHAYSNELTINLGLDGEYTRADFLQYQEQATQGSAFLVATVPQGKHYDYDVDSTLVAPFISLDWQWQQLAISLGARFEQLDYDYSNNMLAGRTDEHGNECGFGGCRYSRPPSSKDSFTNTSPKLGLSYQFSADNYLYANLSRGYRAPQAAELYQLQREQQVADLESEIAENLEVGLKGQYQQLHYVFSAYAMNKQHVIFRDSDFFTINDGQTQHRGIELEFDYQLTQSLQLALAASHAIHRYDYDQVLSGVNINGNDIDTAPRNIANLQANWQVSNNTLVAIEWHHVSDYFTDPENLHSYAGHDLINLRAAWQLTEQLKLTARINNLLDAAYAERADYTSFTGDRYFPGRGRNIMFSASYSW